MHIYTKQQKRSEIQLPKDFVVHTRVAPGRLPNCVAAEVRRRKSSSNLGKTGRLLRNSGSFFLIYPAQRWCGLPSAATLSLALALAGTIMWWLRPMKGAAKVTGRLEWDT